MMVTVVEQGTGSNARIPGVAVGGKTGTAQTAPGQPPHAWFVGVAPADQPGGPRSRWPSSCRTAAGRPRSAATELAAPIAKAVMEAVAAGA